jgi:hydroxymethylpyrimidine pyrophosphatase-like HAD family hydrolase
MARWPRSTDPGPVSRPNPDPRASAAGPVKTDGRVRLLGTDLDGTLLRSDSTVSERTRAALIRAADEGLLVAFATGRPPRWLHTVAEATGHTGVAVAANGAVLYDLATETVLEEHLLTSELLAEVTEELRAEFPRLLFAVEYGADADPDPGPLTSFGYEPGYIHDWEINPPRDRAGRPVPPPLIAELATVISRPGVKLLAKDRDADPDHFLDRVEVLLTGRVSVTHSSSIGLLEIGAIGITKASGLAYVAARHGIEVSEVAAVGDMPNDLPMLAWAGQSYAVANAHPSVLALAQHHLPANDDDGVATLIEALLER